MFQILTVASFKINSPDRTLWCSRFSMTGSTSSSCHTLSGWTINAASRNSSTSQILPTVTNDFLFHFIAVQQEENEPIFVVDERKRMWFRWWLISWQPPCECWTRISLEAVMKEFVHQEEIAAIALTVQPHLTNHHLLPARRRYENPNDRETAAYPSPRHWCSVMDRIQLGHKPQWKTWESRTIVS